MTRESSLFLLLLEHFMPSLSTCSDPFCIFFFSEKKKKKEVEFGRESFMQSVPLTLQEATMVNKKRKTRNRIVCESKNLKK